MQTHWLGWRFSQAKATLMVIFLHGMSEASPTGVECVEEQGAFTVS